MGIEDNFDKLIESIKEYAELKRDAIKLLCVENLSLVSSGILSFLIVILLCMTALFFAFMALIILIAKYIGFMYGSLAIGIALAIVASVVYILRKKLFANVFISRYSKIFFEDDSYNEK